MKYLRKFNTEADVMMFVQPNVVLVADTESVMFNVELPKGVFVQHIDGSLYTADQWTAMGFANDQANGIAVIDDTHKFVIAKTERSSVNWQNTPTLIEGIPTYTTKDDAITDFNGSANTALMNDSSVKAFCSTYSFPNGQKGYVGAAGEWNIVLQNYSAISAALTAIGGGSISSKKYWTSTQESLSNAWVCTTITNSIYADSKTASSAKYYGRPFGELIV